MKTFDDWKAEGDNYILVDCASNSREVWSAAQKSVKTHIYREINKRVVSGRLSGNGFDKTAERNGLILALNTITEIEL